MSVDPQLRVHLIRHARNQIGKPDQTVTDMLIVQMADELDQGVGPNYPSDFNPANEPVAGEDGDAEQATLPVPQSSPAAGSNDPAQSYGDDSQPLPHHPEPNA